MCEYTNIQTMMRMLTFGMIDLECSQRRTAALGCASIINAGQLSARKMVCSEGRSVAKIGLDGTDRWMSSTETEAC